MKSTNLGLKAFFVSPWCSFVDVSVFQPRSSTKRTRTVRVLQRTWSQTASVL